MSQRPGESIREYLDRRENELREECSALRGQLWPKEKELAEVRKAKAALGMSHGSPLSDALLGGPPDQVDYATPLAEFLSKSTPIPPPPPRLGNALLSGDPQPSTWGSLANALIVGESQQLSKGLPHDGQTIKQLIVRALLEGFPRHEGTTATELRDFIHRSYGRDIDRASLSPQLSRLRDDGIIETTEGGVWKLTRGGSRYGETVAKKL
jgi:hypothetical protein